MCPMLDGWIPTVIIMCKFEFKAGKMDKEIVWFYIQVIKGIVEGCKQSDCVLLGGEVKFSERK